MRHPDTVYQSEPQFMPQGKSYTNQACVRVFLSICHRSQLKTAGAQKDSFFKPVAKWWRSVRLGANGSSHLPLSNSFIG